jgi:protein required for attachment to host cells
VIAVADNIWIVVADGASVRFFTSGKRLEDLVEARPALVSEETHGVSRDLKSDHPGRVFNAAQGSSRHAADPQHDPHKLAKHRFAAEVAAVLDRECAAGAFADLVLVAPKRSTGELRLLLSPRVLSHVRQEVQKDLTRLTPARLWPHIAEAVQRTAAGLTQKA